MSEHEHGHIELLKKPLDKNALATAEVAFLAVAGMGCPNCAARVHNALLRLEDVLFVDVSLARGTAAVAFRPARLSPGNLVSAVAHAGNEAGHHYQARLLETMPGSEAFITT